MRDGLVNQGVGNPIDLVSAGGTPNEVVVEAKPADPQILNTYVTKTTSLMTGGFDVTQAHVITAWEALVAMTSAYVAEKWWKIT